MADAVTRSHLSDGRVVGWYGGPGVVVDAEIDTLDPPPALVARHGSDRFWARWTASECQAKLADVPIAIWLQDHELGTGPAEVETFTDLWPGVTVSVGRAPSRD
jgi:hypothetical protein